MELKNRINRILFERGLAEGELASVCRLDQGHLNRIKNGRVKPSVVTALRIGRALGVPVDQIFFLDAAGSGQGSSPSMRGNARAMVGTHRADGEPPRRTAGVSRG